MFAILQRNMESSSVGRLSPNISPPLQTSSTPPPLFGPFVKKEKDADSRESSLKPVKREKSSEELGRNGTTSFEPKDDTTDSQLLTQRLEMYWQGMMKYQQQKLQEQDKAKIESTEVPADCERSGDVIEKAKNIVQRLIGGDQNAASLRGQQMPWPSLTTIATNRQLRSPKNGQNNHISNFMMPGTPTTNSGSSLQQASMLSQRALATMLSLQHMRQENHPNLVSDLGSLLPPPPELVVPVGLTSSSTTSKPYPQFPLSSTVVDVTVASTSEKPTSGSPLDLTHFGSMHSPTSPAANALSNFVSIDSDLPLDLSMSAAGKKRPHDYTPKLSPSSDDLKQIRPPPLLVSGDGDKRRKTTNVSLASIQSNFPTLLNNRAQARAAQRAAVAAHIQNGLTSDSIPVTAGPFTSLYQKQEEQITAAPNSGPLHDLMQSGVPPLQIQQWLLAAVSAQKMQQMALNQISLLQQQRQQPASHPDPPKKRQKMNDNTTSRVHTVQSQLRQSSVGQPHPALLSRSQNSQTTDAQLHYASGRPNSFPSTNSRNPKAISPTLSPDSTQSQSGKRYRRYAKPPYSYVSLITLSILSSRNKKLRLSQILKRISEMFPFFNGSYQGWRDSVRHNLSQNECFVKVLKNPYRPTAKGNFWTVNLSSIPHELLLRQNTLVSRYAQDSGYRYRKDLSEVFDLRTGALKVPVPRHLLRDTGDPNVSVLSEDPAAVMEAILLQETSDDEMTDYKDKITPDVRQFTLEDLFSQNEDGDDDSHSSGRGRARNKQASHSAPLTHPPTMLPQSYASALYQPSNTMVNGLNASLHNRALEAQNLAAMGMLPQVLLSQGTSQSAQIPLALSNAAPNPFAAAQTALLSKALVATQLQGFDGLPALQKMFYANQTPQKANFNVPYPNVAPTKTSTSAQNPISPIPKRFTPSPIHPQEQHEENDQSILSDHSSILKRNKRKGVLPVRHTVGENTAAIQSYADSSLSPRNSFSIPTSGASRTLSSEADSAASVNQFCSPVTSSNKSQSSSSPRHDESSEFEDSRHPSQNIFDSQAATGISSFQALQMYGAPSLQASKMA